MTSLKTLALNAVIGDNPPAKKDGTPRIPDLMLPLGLVVVQIAATKQIWGEKWRDMENPFGVGTQWEVPAVTSVLYLLLIFVGPMLMKKREPMDSFCRPYMLIYNLYQTVFNIWWVGSMIYEVYKLGYPLFHLPLDTSPKFFNVGMLVWLHYQNKYIEMLDTAFMVLRKKNDQISFLHCYHHLLLMWAWFFVCKFGCGGESYFGATVNAFIHVLMYGYYFLATLQIKAPWKKYLTQLQMIQFCVCFCHGLYVAFYVKVYPVRLALLDLWVMTNMLVLFASFYSKKYKKNQANAKLKGNGKASSES